MKTNFTDKVQKEPVAIWSYMTEFTVLSTYTP